MLLPLSAAVRAARALGLIGLLAAAAAARAEVIEVPLRTPPIESLEATLPAPAGDVSVALRLGFDERGRLVAAGPCEVDGEPVEVLGRIRSRAGGVGLRLAARGAGGAIAVTISGSLDAPLARFRYRGPRGAWAGEAPVELVSAPAGAVLRITLLPHVDCDGAISGSGIVVAGLGPESGLPGVLDGRVGAGGLSWTLRCGARRVSFRGRPEGGAYAGALTLRLPPERGRRDGVVLGASFAALFRECAEPPPEPAGRALYLPLVPGGRWTYRVTRFLPHGAAVGALTDTVLAFERDGEAIVETSAAPDLEMPPRRARLVSTIEGLTVAAVLEEGEGGAAIEENLAPYSLFLPEILRPGDLFERSYGTARGETIVETVRVETFQTIELASGRFERCARVLRAARPLGLPAPGGHPALRRSLSWFAPGLGLVRVEEETTSAAGETTRALRELEAFTVQ